MTLTKRTYRNGGNEATIFVESDRSSSSGSNTVELRETGSISRKSSGSGITLRELHRRHRQQQQGNYSYEAFVAQCKRDVGVALNEADREALRASKSATDYTKFVESLKELDNA